MIKLPGWPKNATRAEKEKKLETYREIYTMAKEHGATEFAKHWAEIVAEAERILCVSEFSIRKQAAAFFAQQQWAEAYCYK